MVINPWYKRRFQKNPTLKVSVNDRPYRINPNVLPQLDQQPYPIINQPVFLPCGAGVLTQGAHQVINQGMGSGAENAIAPGNDVQPRQIATLP